VEKWLDRLPSFWSDSAMKIAPVVSRRFEVGRRLWSTRSTESAETMSLASKVQTAQSPSRRWILGRDGHLISLTQTRVLAW
jgi:hypothetical protein